MHSSFRRDNGIEGKLNGIAAETYTIALHTINVCSLGKFDSACSNIIEALRQLLRHYAKWASSVSDCQDEKPQSCWSENYQSKNRLVGSKKTQKYKWA